MSEARAIRRTCACALATLVFGFACGDVGGGASVLNPRPEDPGSSDQAHSPGVAFGGELDDSAGGSGTGSVNAPEVVDPPALRTDGGVEVVPVDAGVADAASPAAEGGSEAGADADAPDGGQTD